VSNVIALSVFDSFSLTDVTKIGCKEFPSVEAATHVGIQKSSKKDYSPVSTQQNLLYSDGYQRIGWRGGGGDG
jgi:hypothetical protein